MLTSFEALLHTYEGRSLWTASDFAKICGTLMKYLESKTPSLKEFLKETNKF